jgi:hypothetical protein
MWIRIQNTGFFSHFCFPHTFLLVFLLISVADPGLPDPDPLVRGPDPDHDFLSLKKDVNVPSKSNKQTIFVAVLKVSDENSRIRSRFIF